VLEAHATLEKMRNDFELEREGYAIAERELRSRLATEAEQYQALEAAQHAMQEHVAALRAQNETLLDAYASAKHLSSELVRGTQDLASAFEKPVPEVPPMPEVKPAVKDSSKSDKKPRGEAEEVEPSVSDNADDGALEDEDEHAEDGARVGRSGAKA
jgi:multidrug resistance efflux pump